MARGCGRVGVASIVRWVRGSLGEDTASGLKRLPVPNTRLAYKDMVILHIVMMSLMTHHLYQDHFSIEAN